MVDLIRLGETIRATRQKRKRSQRAVAKEAGISATFLSEIERAYVNPKRGSAVRPSDENLAAIAKSLSIAPIVLHASMGRVDFPSARIVEIEADYQHLEELEEQGTFIANYNELPPASQKLVNDLVKELLRKPNKDIG